MKKSLPEENPLQKEYEHLYADTDYGHAEKDACPGVRYLPHYKGHLLTPVLDVGCGSGDTVFALRSEGFAADGIDWIRYHPGMMCRDLREPFEVRGYASCICIDVLEHLDIEHIPQVLHCMKDCTRQVVSVHTGSSKSPLGTELHITQRPLRWWDELIKLWLWVHRCIIIEPGVRALYLCG